MSTKNLETLAKWRQVFTLMATMGNPTAIERYLRDTAEKHLLMRAELNALTALLIQKGVFSQLEFTAQLDVEAEELCAALEKAFPGFKATEDGMSADPPAASATMRGWTEPYGGG